jgi:hypothetical protein
MNTSTQVIQTLEQARSQTNAATAMIHDLIAPHDYQDVAVLVAQAAEALLEAAVRLMQADDEAAFVAMERADDRLEEVYDIIEADLDDE